MFSMIDAFKSHVTVDLCTVHPYFGSTLYTLLFFMFLHGNLCAP